MTMVWLMLRRHEYEHEHCMYTKSQHDQKDSSRYLQLQHLLLLLVE